LGESSQGIAVVSCALARTWEGDVDACSRPGRPRSGLSRRQALAGFGIALIGGVSGSVASARAAVAPARGTRAGLAAGLTNAQLAGQRVIASYPGGHLPSRM